MIGNILLYAGPIGYITIWILYFIITNTCELTIWQKKLFFLYALIPWGAICTSGTGYIINCLANDSSSSSVDKSFSK